MVRADPTAGFRVVSVPSARIWHRIKDEDRAQSPLYLYLMTRNRLLYLVTTGAPLWIRAAVVLASLRRAASWSLRPRWRGRRWLVPTLVRAVLDGTRGRFGEPPACLFAVTAPVPDASTPTPSFR